MSFNLLSEPIRKFIRDKGWDHLRPIQSAAINKIMSSDDNFIIAARTASGKTEAAFLPILSKVNFNSQGVQVLYVSPLIALINDQFTRIEELCRNLDISVTKWHGEANKTRKNKLTKQPSGIVLITPESLEAMFVNKPFLVKQMFSNLKYVVIDEIHSFIGTDRGVQLKSVLSRLKHVNSDSFSIVGLSATIGDYNEAKLFTGDKQRTIVLLDRTAKEINAAFRFFKNTNDELPIALLNKLYNETKESKVLIFPNSRGRAEEVAVKLKKISEKEKGHSNYFSHHSSLDREVREYVEYFAKNNKRHNFCISCTSTLELGIDIGTVDEIVQIDATHSISSLIQRVGRSGRKEGERSNLFLYATSEWGLLQSIACWLLYNEEYIEPPAKDEKPYDILAHQALSITKGYSGVKYSDLILLLKNNYAFNLIEEFEIEEILNHLIEIDFLEKIGKELIIGLRGEQIVNNRDFYSVFMREENYKVINSGKTIGELPFSAQILENENILLSAKIWKIKLVDHKAKKIEVAPSNDGKKPKFFGRGAFVHDKIREKMLEILFSKAEYNFLDEASSNQVEIMRRDFSVFNLQNLQTDRPFLKGENRNQLFTFTGTRINNTFQLLLNISGVKSNLDDRSSSFEIDGTKEDFFSKKKVLANHLSEIDVHISALLQKTPSLMNFSKWGPYIPKVYQVKLLKEKHFDIKQTEVMLKEMKLIENN